MSLLSLFATRCVGCGRKLHHVISCNCGAALCSEVCFRRHQKGCNGKSNAGAGLVGMLIGCAVLLVGCPLGCLGFFAMFSDSTSRPTSQVASSPETQLDRPNGRNNPLPRETSSQRTGPQPSPATNEQPDAERIAREKAEAERIAREKSEADRIAREKADADRIAREKAAAEEKQRLREQDAKTLLDLAKRSIDAGQKPAARRTLQSLLTQFPDTKAAAEARKLLNTLN